MNDYQPRFGLYFMVFVCFLHSCSSGSFQSSDREQLKKQTEAIEQLRNDVKALKGK